MVLRGGISIVRLALVILVQNASFTHPPVDLIRRYDANINVILILRVLSRSNSMNFVLFRYKRESYNSYFECYSCDLTNCLRRYLRVVKQL